MIAVRPQPRFAFSHPAHFIAFGFGAGLAPFAPGTAGTLLAFPLWWVLGAYPPAVLLAIVAFLFAVGVWACDVTGRRMGVADHGAMCWDETVAFLLVLAIAPQDWRWQAAAFVLFRAFDVVKPPPIRQVDRLWKTPAGVMADDLLAGAYTVLVIAFWQRLT